jgi:hypothetical protein
MLITLGSLEAVISRLSLSEVAFVRCVLLVENRLKLNPANLLRLSVILPIELWIKILSLSQHEYIPCKTVTVVAVELQHSDTEREKITAYNEYNTKLDCAGL